jgi:hypothetical protein
MANSSPLLLVFFHRASPKFLKERSTIWLRLLHDSPKLALHYLIPGSFLSHKRHEKEQQKTRKRTAQLREATHNVSEFGEGQREKHTGILQTLKTSQKRDPKEAEKRMISSFAQVPIFLRPGNIHVPVIFEWSTSSLETTKAANNCVTDSALVPSMGNSIGNEKCHQLLPGSATVPFIGNVFGKDPCHKTCLYYKSTACFFFFLVCPWPDLS